MSNLILVEKPSTEKQLIISALSDVNIKESSLEELSKIVSAAVDQGIFYLGLNTSQYDRDMIKITVMDDCRSRFQGMTLSEIKIAIDNGVRGKYGEVIGLAPKDVFHWISSFKQESVRLDAIKELEASNDFNMEPSDEEKAKVAYLNLLNAWEQFKVDGYYNDFGNVVYDILALNKKISFTPEQREQFKFQAKRNLVTEFNPNKHLGDDLKMKEAMKMVSSINSGTAEQRIISEAKRIALNYFFNELRESGKELTELFI